MLTAKRKRRRPPAFELIAGNLCLDFINTLDNRPSGEVKELLNDYADFARFGQETGIISPTHADRLADRAAARSAEAAGTLRRARTLREALYQIVAALLKKRHVPQFATDTLNENLREAACHLRLVQQGRHFEWRLDDLTSTFDGMMWPIARAAAELLASPNMELVRACSSPTCQWFFLDTSKNHNRRWCSMKLCGNRTKVRRFYARRKNAH